MKYLKVNIENGIGKITLDRPEVKNALNAELIQELSEAFLELNSDTNTKITIITGNGNTFCSGADLNWLKEAKDNTYEENYNDSKKLVELLDIIQSHTKPTIARVNGTAVGGGVGIILSCDLIIADSKASFGVSEVSIGIIPAAIVHLLIERIGITKAKEYLLIGNRIGAMTAQNIGLINYSVPTELLDEAINSFTNKLLSNGKVAMKKVKEMIMKVKILEKEKLNDYISNTIAELRIGEEAKEGITAFFEKRKPNW